MLFVNKFCPPKKYYNITNDIPNLVFSIWTQQRFACSNSTIRIKLEICLQLTTKTEEWRYWHRSRIFILNFKGLPHLIFARQVLTLNRWFIPGMNNIIRNPLKIKSFLPLNFAITKTHVDIGLAVDGTRIGGI